MSGHGFDSLRVTLVVPCFNEAVRLDRQAFAQALTTTGWLDFCFVDDGSTDGTRALLEQLQAAHPKRVQVLALERNSGKAEAVRQGLLRVASTSPIVGFWDADLATPIEECSALRDVLVHGTADWVFGIRLRSLGRLIVRRPLRHYLGRLFATVTSLVLGIDSYDTQCGAKLFRVTPLLGAVLAEPFRSRWIFDVEMLVRADTLLRGERGSPASGVVNPSVESLVHEYPLSRWAHQAGSKVRPGDFIRALRELFVVRADRARWRTRRISA
jgi:glycosyltransferase involved in cell wall biosynthesis